MMVLAFFVARYSHSESSGERSRSVARAKHVILRFIPTQEAADAAILFDGWQQVPPAGQNLVGVGLVANVLDKTVVWRFKGVMQCHSQLYCPKRGAGVATNTRHGFKYVLPNLVGYLLQSV